MMSRRFFLGLASSVIATGLSPIVLFDRWRQKSMPIVIDLYSRDVLMALLPRSVISDFAKEVSAKTSGRVQVRFSSATLNSTRERLETVAHQRPFKMILFTPQLRKEHKRLPQGPWIQSTNDVLARERNLISEEGHRHWIQAYASIKSFPLYFGTLDDTTVLELGLHPQFVKQLSPVDYHTLKSAAANVGRKITMKAMRRPSLAQELKVHFPS